MTRFTPFDARQVDPRIRLAMRILELEQTRVPSLANLAARVGLSSFRLAHLFSEQLGEGCNAYSRRVRLEGSVNQILHDRANMATVAATFGYTSQAAYTRAFSRHFGLSPRQYVARVAGATHQRGADGHLRPVGGLQGGERLLPGRVDLVFRPAAQALARRFYGHDLNDHWRCFLTDLPSLDTRAVTLIGMAYDNASVTPPERWRYDCAIVTVGGWLGPDAASGLDPVEIPDGLHAEVQVTGGMRDVWRATIGLFTEWLPERPDLRPEGDPIPHRLETPPDLEPLCAVASIRVRPRADTPSYNMQPLTRHGATVGRRSHP